MVLDVFWTAGEILSIVGLLYGAGLVLMETVPSSRLFGKKVVVPRPCSAEDLRLISGLARSSSASHPVCIDVMPQGAPPQFKQYAHRQLDVDPVITIRGES